MHEYTGYEYRICVECEYPFLIKVARTGSKCFDCKARKYNNCEYEDKNGNQCDRIRIKHYFYKTDDGIVHWDTKRSEPDSKRMCLDHAHQEFGIVINDIQQLLREVFCSCKCVFYNE